MPRAFSFKKIGEVLGNRGKPTVEDLPPPKPIETKDGKSPPANETVGREEAKKAVDIPRPKRGMEGLFKEGKPTIKEPEDFEKSVHGKPGKEETQMKEFELERPRQFGELAFHDTLKNEMRGIPFSYRSKRGANSERLASNAVAICKARGPGWGFMIVEGKSYILSPKDIEAYRLLKSEGFDLPTLTVL